MSTAPARIEDLLNTNQVLELVNHAFSKSFLYSRSSSFPQPIKLSERTMRWRKADVLKWVEDHGLKLQENSHV